MTQKVTYTQAHAQLANLLEQATDDHEIVIITRQDKAPAALISTEALSGLLESAHLLRSPASAQNMLFGLNQALGRIGRPTTVEDLQAEVGLVGG